jgi:hypothetical protein
MVSVFNVMTCINTGCRNEVCAITGKKRNLKKVNIFYDILKVRHTKQGFVELAYKEIVKGIKVFPRPIATTDAEIWIKTKAKDFEPSKNHQDRAEKFFSEHHKKYTERKNGKTSKEYDYFKFEMILQNMRIGVRENRDPIQDLKDTSEGIKVIHANDILKRRKEEKSERRKKHKEYMQRRKEKQEQGITSDIKSNQMSLFDMEDEA